LPWLVVLDCAEDAQVRWLALRIDLGGEFTEVLGFAKGDSSVGFDASWIWEFIKFGG
jgi:hypothetical protein